MKALRFLGVFLVVSIATTVAAVTALFTIWSFISVQPGTATALGMLFLFAPGLGIAAGLVAAVRANRTSTLATRRTAAPNPVMRLLAVSSAGIFGWLFAHGSATVLRDIFDPLTFANGVTSPRSAWPPIAAGLAGALAMAALAYARQWGARR